MDKISDVDQLRSDRDDKSLIRILRRAENVDVRTKAAQALGEIGNLSAVESLIRSYLQDPISDVQAAAYHALQWMLGTETQTAISAYSLPEDPWLQKESSDQQVTTYEDEVDSANWKENSGDIREVSWDANDIRGLTATIRVDTDFAKRLKAIQALSQIEDTRAIDALASIALWSDEKTLREGARDALLNIYGDNLEEVLQSYRDSNPGGNLEIDEEEDADEEDEQDQEEEVDEAPDQQEALQPDQPSASNSAYQNAPVIQEENQGLNNLIFGIILLILLALVIYLLTR